MECSPIMKVSTGLPKYHAIFLFLVVFVFIFVLRNTDFLEHKENSTIILPRVSTDQDMRYEFCVSQLRSPKDTLEERLLLDSITWPETPVLPVPFSLKQTSDPAHSNFTILSGRGGGQWHVGDQLEAMIKMNDFQGHPKKSRGDVLLNWLHNPTHGAGVAGQVVDHLNGSYSARFSLLLEGSAQVEVMLNVTIL